MTRTIKEKRAHGQIRQSQLITTFGPGAMMDLPNHSVLLAGLDSWLPGGEEIEESRLCSKVCSLLDLQTVKLRTPPPHQEAPSAPRTGISAWQFPEWFMTHDVHDSNPTSKIRSRRLIHKDGLTRGYFIDLEKKKRPVVPIRFVRACRSGHIGDIDWYAFVHNGKTDCHRPLWIDERGTSGDLTEIYVRCECKQERSMAQASIPQNRALGHCDGSRPWLGRFTRETCGEPSRLLIRTASNAYFPQVLSVISLPERDNAVRQAIVPVWEFLSELEDAQDVERERKKARVKDALEGFSNEEVFSEIQKRRNPTPEINKSVKQAELETLLASQAELGEDTPNGNFFARTLPKENVSAAWMKSFEKVVLVHRLREVAALVGFTRFEALAPDTEGELEIGVQRAALARETSWIPAVENKGEGVFLQFNSDAIQRWLQKPKVQQRGAQLLAGFDSWKREHSSSKREFPNLPYVFIHSLSHLLITAVSLECGYPASSIRERVYALPDIGYGLLLYTGSTGSEGTLGGLVEVGRKIERHMKAALELGELCSNDPVCAQHSADNPHERRFLLGAACHGCLLIAESSCELHNDFLDRALVVETVDSLQSEFFEDLSVCLSTC